MGVLGVSAVWQRVSSARHVRELCLVIPAPSLQAAPADPECRHAAFWSWPTLLTCEFEKKEGEEEDEASATGIGSGLFHSKRWVRHIRRWHNVPGSSWIPPTLDLQLANEKWNLNSLWTLWVNWIYRLNWGEIVCSIDFSYLGICCHYLIHFSLPSFNENYSFHIVNFLFGFFHGYFQAFLLLWWFFLKFVFWCLDNCNYNQLISFCIWIFCLANFLNS